jgi:CheY-like chemotaxis protein
MSRPATILLVEDNENDALLMRHAFKRAGINNSLLRARDGEEAIDYLAGNGVFADRDLYPFPALVLLDLKMPRVDGFEVLRWIRSQMTMKGLPVTVLTSSDQQWDIEKAHELGVTSYLQKPNELYDLVALLKALQSYWTIVEKPLCAV